LLYRIVLYLGLDDLGEDQDQLEEEQEESAELTSAVTTNQIF